jgi:hypothetical protein
MLNLSVNVYYILIKYIMAKFKNISGSKLQLVSSSDKYFDDCPVCRLMKKVEKEGRQPTLEELTEAFEKANNQN